MPIVTIMGLPDRLQDTGNLSYLMLNLIPEAVASVQGLGCTIEQVTTFAPRDLLQAELGYEIIVFIDSSRFCATDQSPQARQAVCDEVCDRVAAVLEEFANQNDIDWQLIEVLPRLLGRGAERIRPKAEHDPASTKYMT